MKEIIIEVPENFGKTLKPEKVNSEIKGELVRCKNCTYGHEFQTGLYSCDRNRGRNKILFRFEDWYCGDGIKK